MTRTIPAAAFVFLACPPLPALDVGVARLEITQGFQIMMDPPDPMLDNSVPLVAGRSSVVRATLSVTGAAVVNGITGSLSLSVNGAAVGSFPPKQIPFTAPLTPQRANELDTLNFYIPGIGQSVDVDIVVSITAPADTNSANDSKSLLNLRFTEPEHPEIYFTGIIYPTVSFMPPDPSYIQKGVGEAMVKAIYPLNDKAAALYNPGLFSSLSFDDKWGLLTMIDGIDDFSPPGKDVDKLLSLLESCRLLIVSGGVGAKGNIFLYAWLRDNPISAKGWAGGCVGFGNTDPARHQRTFAHEFMHMCRQNAHITDTLDHVGWDIGPYLPNNPPGNGVTGAVRPTSLFDITTPSLLTNQAWIDHGTYEWFMPSPMNGFSCTPGGVGMPDLSEQALNIQGSFNTGGDLLVELEPTFRFPWSVETYPEDAEGPYQVEVTNAFGVVITRRFDALVGHDGDDPALPAEIRGFFSLSVPVEGTADLLRITDPSGVTEYGRLERSQSPPQIVITSPTAGSDLDGWVAILWSPSDADTPVSNLVYQVAYSPDGGSSFVPVAVDLLGIPEALLEAPVVPQTSAPGTGLIRIFASDGLNTTFADVVGLTVVGRMPPFSRGDVDGDGSMTLTDSISLFGYLFLGNFAPACLAAANSNSDDELNIADGIYSLNYLFLGGPSPPPPFPDCATSEAGLDVALGCATAPTCP